jgi:hypothetical protein
MIIPLGALLPSSLLGTPFFSVLSTLVALNTLGFVTLAVAKMLPKIHLTEIFGRRGRRQETRSIYPDAPPEA